MNYQKFEIGDLVRWAGSIDSLGFVTKNSSPDPVIYQIYWLYPRHWKLGYWHKDSIQKIS
jgi:hypothetical protein